MTFEGLDIADFSQLPLRELTLIEAAVAEADVETSDSDIVPRSSGEALDEALRREADEQRVAAGGSAHSAAPDVRRTPNQSAEKLAATARLGSDSSIAFVRSSIWVWAIYHWIARPRRSRAANCSACGWRHS